MRTVPENTFMTWPKGLTGVAIPFEEGGGAGFRFGCKVG